MSIVKDYTAEYVYFLYSAEQFKLRTEVESKVNKKFIPGEVLVNGDWKEFTQISASPTSPMFVDAKVVAEGYKDRIKFKECTSEWKI